MIQESNYKFTTNLLKTLNELQNVNYDVEIESIMFNGIFENIVITIERRNEIEWILPKQEKNLKAIIKY